VTADAETKLFTPPQIGAIALTRRVVMAPLTRSRQRHWSFRTRLVEGSVRIGQVLTHRRDGEARTRKGQG
jgi:hypothetical protein